MQVVAYAPDVGARSLLADARTVTDLAVARWAVFEEWARFEPAALCGDGPVVVGWSNQAGELSEQTDALRAVLGSGLVILGPPNTPRGIKGLPSVVTTTTTGLRHDLPWALRGAHVANALRQFATRIQRANLSDMMKRFVSVALLSEPPIGTVATLAARCRRSPQDVWYHWRVEANAGSPKRLLQGVLLVHATVGRPHGVPCERMAFRLGTTPQSLRRAARTLLSTTLSAACESHGVTALETLRSNLGQYFGLSEACEDTGDSRSAEVGRAI